VERRRSRGNASAIEASATLRHGKSRPGLAAGQKVVNHDRLVLEVTDSNISAARSYRAYGFVETGRQRPMERDSSTVQIEFAYPLHS
jgi:ribosomal protein S18 acetylase RimI-like enzyme